MLLIYLRSECGKSFSQPSLPPELEILALAVLSAYCVPLCRCTELLSVMTEGALPVQVLVCHLCQLSPAILMAYF